MWKIGPVLATVPHAARPRPPLISPAHLRPLQHLRGRTRHHRLIVADNHMAVAPTSRSAQQRERGQTRKMGESPSCEAFTAPQCPHGQDNDGGIRGRALGGCADALGPEGGVPAASPSSYAHVDIDLLVFRIWICFRFRSKLEIFSGAYSWQQGVGGGCAKRFWI